MSDQLDLFARPLRSMSRRSDPATSHGAAVVALHGAPNLRLRCLQALQATEQGLTDFELAAVVGRQQTSVGKRRLELQRAGFVGPLMCGGVQVRRPSPTNTPALVWVAL